MTDKQHVEVGQVRTSPNKGDLWVKRITDEGMVEMETLGGDWHCLMTYEWVAQMPLVEGT